MTDRKPHVLPCWPIGQACPNSCAQRTMDHLTANKVQLSRDWYGWRFAGRDLVSPHGDRVNPQRLLGLLWREKAKRNPRPARVYQLHQGKYQGEGDAACGASPVGLFAPASAPLIKAVFAAEKKLTGPVGAGAD